MKEITITIAVKDRDFRELMEQKTLPAWVKKSEKLSARLAHNIGLDAKDLVGIGEVLKLDCKEKPLPPVKVKIEDEQGVEQSALLVDLFDTRAIVEVDGEVLEIPATQVVWAQGNEEGFAAFVQGYFLTNGWMAGRSLPKIAFAVREATVSILGGYDSWQDAIFDVALCATRFDVYGREITSETILEALAWEDAKGFVWG